MQQGSDEAVVAAITVVTDLPTLRMVVKEVLCFAQGICVDVEAGEKGQHRHSQSHGAICMLQLRAAGSKEVYLVDLHTLLHGPGSSASSASDVSQVLSRLLSDRGPLKLLWDVRKDSEALNRELTGLTLGNTLDLQCVEGSAVWLTCGARRRLGLSTAMQRYLPHISEPPGHAKILDAMKNGNWKGWDERPLSTEMKEYAAFDVQHLDALHDALGREYGYDIILLAFKLTAEYIKAFTDRPRRFDIDDHPGTFHEELLRYYIGDKGVCHFCGTSGHEPHKCFNRSGVSEAQHEQHELQSARADEGLALAYQ